MEEKRRGVGGVEERFCPAAIVREDRDPSLLLSIPSFYTINGFYPR